MEKKLRKRSEISSKDKWNMEDIYATDDGWQQEYDQIKQQMKELITFEGTLSESKERLYDYLLLTEKIEKLLERIVIYANQRYHEDTANSFYQKFVDLANTLKMDYLCAVSFFEPEILSIGQDKINQFLSEDTNMMMYQRYFDEIFRSKEHVLSPELENLLANTIELAEVPGNVFAMFSNADLKFPEVKDEKGNSCLLTQGTYGLYLKSHDRVLRRNAYETLYHTYSQFKNTTGSLLSSEMKKNVFYAKVKKYDSSLERALDNGNIPVSVYYNLIEVVHKYLPVMYRYMNIRKKVLNVEELCMYDMYVPLVELEETTYTFEMAKDVVYQGLEALGEEYRSILQQGFDGGWIDIYENEGKRSGAYSWGPYGTHPYVLLNYHETLNDIFTLAHEMGHAIHSYYSDQTQPYIYAGYRIFVAEVASTCNEALLMHHLLKQTTDPKMKLFLLNYYIEEFRTTLFRQTMFAEFELKAHQAIENGESMTSEDFCKIYGELNELYYGAQVMTDEQIRMEWARIPHFYTAFYVYQYATGYSAAIALSQKILLEGEVAVKNYITKFLSGGSSKDPIDLLKDAGVDMSTKEPVEAALKVFEELVNEFESLI